MACNHNPNEKKSTIELDLKNKTMQYPQLIQGYCKECYETFVYEKRNGKYIEVNK